MAGRRGGGWGGVGAGRRGGGWGGVYMGRHFRRWHSPPAAGGASEPGGEPGVECGWAHSGGREPGHERGGGGRGSGRLECPAGRAYTDTRPAPRDCEWVSVGG